MSWKGVVWIMKLNGGLFSCKDIFLSMSFSKPPRSAAWKIAQRAAFVRNISWEEIAYIQKLNVSRMNSERMDLLNMLCIYWGQKFCKNSDLGIKVNSLYANKQVYFLGYTAYLIQFKSILFPEVSVTTKMIILVVHVSWVSWHQSVKKLIFCCLSPSKLPVQNYDLCNVVVPSLKNICTTCSRILTKVKFCCQKKPCF